MAPIRPSYAISSHEDGGKDIPDDGTYTVTSRHPGYRVAHNIIMVLPALDDAQGDIHHETARIACAIVAGNRWEGYFSEERTGSRTMTPEAGILLGKEYYFRISGDAEVWNLPSIWSQFTIPNMPPGRALPRQGGLTDALLARDITCRLTDAFEGTEHAHLVPRSKVAWFQQNNMFRYSVSPRPEVELIEAPRNALLLRSGIYTVFDQRRLAIVPKPLPSDDTGRANHTSAAHVFSPSSSTQFAKLYHHVAIQPSHGISLEYMFARFASTVFAYSAQFLQQGVKRALCIVQDGEMTVEDFNEDQCIQLYQSRKARKEQEFGDEDENDRRRRGRPRLRSWSSAVSTAGASYPSTLAEDTPLLTDHSTIASDEDVPPLATAHSSVDTTAKSDLPVQETVFRDLPT
ncbi:hypothetical protein D6C78_10404 [Aureobasidium pullulans]|uniref:Ig-like domain-containing protein n=1 Tax=Aureobasidium pullulans TaxID=5580 RepID=A0A4V6TKN2_AURPU|nr:hypothetical protein D6C78_10404 [Aureobasidium pullulans]